MEAWRRALKGEPLFWLLEPETPAVRHLALQWSSTNQRTRRSGEEYLLERALFRRLSTGEPADERFFSLQHPDRWHYHVLRALDHFRSAAALTGEPSDPRLGEAIDHVRSRGLENGTWPLDRSPAGRVWFDVDDGEGAPSRWVTLRALRVLRWWEEGGR